MASVHLAYDSVLDRQVAIKTLHTELGREQAFRERFRREAQAVAKLTHTNIVSVFDTGEDDLDGTTMPYIVMEYVEGQPLGSVLNTDVGQHGAMPADKALKITADVLAALEISHEMGLVHRDIKPGNVMMTKRGVVKVMDFGIARAMQSGVTSMTQTGMVVGTPQYLSRAGARTRRGRPLRPLLRRHHALPVGHRPHCRSTRTRRWRSRTRTCRRSRSLLRRSTAPCRRMVDALVARALKKNPNERFPSAEAMRDECLRVAASVQPAAPSIVPGSPTQSGAGVGSAVFPPIDQTPPPQGNVQTPYQPTPHPYGNPTPSAHSPAYGYPQQQGYQAPGPAAYAPQQGASTPPPYNLAPQTTVASPGGGGKGNKPVIIGSIVVSLVAVGGLLAALMMNSGGSDDAGGDPSASPSVSATKEAGYRGPDTTKTIETTECSEPEESYNDPDQVRMPDFQYKNWDSVLECLKAAGWHYTTNDVDENTFGDGTVMKQFPEKGTDFDPKKPPKMQFDVSTGNPS